MSENMSIQQLPSSPIQTMVGINQLISLATKKTSSNLSEEVNEFGGFIALPYLSQSISAETPSLISVYLRNALQILRTTIKENQTETPSINFSKRGGNNSYYFPKRKESTKKKVNISSRLRSERILARKVIAKGSPNKILSKYIEENIARVNNKNSEKELVEDGFYNIKKTTPNKLKKDKVKLSDTKSIINSLSKHFSKKSIDHIINKPKLININSLINKNIIGTLTDPLFLAYAVPIAIATNYGRLLVFANKKIKRDNKKNFSKENKVKTILPLSGGNLPKIIN